MIGETRTCWCGQDAGVKMRYQFDLRHWEYFIPSELVKQKLMEWDFAKANAKVRRTFVYILYFLLAPFTGKYEDPFHFSTTNAAFLCILSLKWVTYMWQCPLNCIPFSRVFNCVLRLLSIMYDLIIISFSFPFSWISASSCKMTETRTCWCGQDAGVTLRCQFVLKALRTFIPSEQVGWRLMEWYFPKADAKFRRTFVYCTSS